MVPESRHVRSRCISAWEIGPVGSRQHHQQDLGEVDGNFHTEDHSDSRLFSTVQLSEMTTKIKEITTIIW